ncbi:hypothetical protein KBD71_04345 [Candidatus Woesebacteria bacterium]|nr:hypothetical protein [Candidatus Woesebacteria bacterium]
MRKLIFILSTIFFLTLGTKTLSAQEIQPEIASDSATVSGELSSSSADLQPTAVPAAPSIGSSNITESQGVAENRLQDLLDQQQIGPIQPLNLLQHAVRRAVASDIPITTVAFLLLFPLIATVIAFARHIVGLSGLSMYAPAALSVALISIGIVPGTILFLGIILFGTVSKTILTRFKLPYLPRTAMVLWCVSLGVFGLLMISTSIPFFPLSILNVFALLILILLSENFLELQASLSPSAAMQRVFETFVLGFLCALILGSEIIQSIAILYPEVTLAVIALTNFVIGRYLGLRFTELLRFRSIIETEE